MTAAEKKFEQAMRTPFVGTDSQTAFLDFMDEKYPGWTSKKNTWVADLYRLFMAGFIIGIRKENSRLRCNHDFTLHDGRCLNCNKRMDELDKAEIVSQLEGK